MKKILDYYVYILFIGIVIYLISFFMINAWDEKTIRVETGTTVLSLEQNNYYLFLPDKTTSITQTVIDSTLHATYTPAAGLSYTLTLAIENENGKVLLVPEFSKQHNIDNYGRLYTSFTIESEDDYTIDISTYSPDQSSYLPYFYLIPINPIMYNTVHFLSNFALLISVIIYLPIITFVVLKEQKNK